MYSLSNPSRELCLIFALYRFYLIRQRFEREYNIVSPWCFFFLVRELIQQ